LTFWPIDRIAIEKFTAGGEGSIEKNFPEIDCGAGLIKEHPD
jgi:hypothetical protein